MHLVPLGCAVVLALGLQVRAFLCQVEDEAQTAVESASGWDDPGFTDDLRALAAVQDEIELLHAASTEELEAIRGNGRSIGAV